MPEEIKRLTKSNEKGEPCMDCESCDAFESPNCTAYYCRQRLMMRVFEFEELCEKEGFSLPKMGKWILVKYYRDEEGTLCPIFRCSRCGIPHDEDKQYCPNCGTNMSNAGTSEEEAKNG